MIEDAVNKTIETYDRIADEYAKDRSYSVEQITLLANKFMYCLNGNKILDVGCGYGRDSKYFSEKGFKVIGVDLCSNLLKIAKQYSLKAKFAQMDMRKLGFHDDCFDGLWSCASFLHIPKTFANNTLKEFYRVLKTNGELFISVKEGDGEQIIEQKFGSRFFAFYSQRECQKLIEDSGFKIFNAIVGKSKEEIWISLFARKI